MSVTATAKRRRRQALNGYRHLARIGRGNNNRSIIRKPDAAKAARRQQQLVERQREMMQRKGRKR
jgi:hypothetical protein